MLTRERGQATWHGDQRHHHEHGHEREGVDEEHERRAGRGQQQAADRRSDRAGQVLVDRSQRDGLGTLLRRNELWLQGLGDRTGESLSDADSGQADQQHRGGHEPGDIQEAKRRRREQHDQLSGEDEALAIQQVAEHARGDRQQQDRQVGGLDRTDQQRRARQRDHHPLRRHRLHPAPDVRHQVREPLQPELPVSQRAPARAADLVRVPGGSGCHLRPPPTNDGHSTREPDPGRPGRHAIVRRRRREPRPVLWAPARARAPAAGASGPRRRRRRRRRPAFRPGAGHGRGRPADHDARRAAP